MAACIVACTSDRPETPAQPAPGQTASQPTAPLSSGGAGLTLKIEPREANRKTLLTLTAEGFTPSDGGVVWQVNGAPASSTEILRFDCSGTRRGDSVRAAAIVNGREILSNEVVIGNTPPELNDVTLLPVTTDRGESLAVSASAYDADGDAVRIQYTWTVNDAPAGNGERLGRALKRNDSVRVEVMAHDGQAYGGKIVLSRTIANNPPVFIEHQDFTTSGGSLQYRARATDADGDQITFTLASPINGMSIDQTTGSVVWAVPDGFRGEQPITIIADDGHSGTSQYTVTFTIRD